MIPGFHEYLMSREGVWLFYVLAYGEIISTVTLIILVLELFFDFTVPKWRTQLKRKTKNKVKIVVGADGQYQVVKCPKGIDVSIEHQGEQK
jgi:hypothetical protein